MKKRLAEAENRFDRLCGKASEVRRRAAKALEKELEQALSDLNFMHVEFSVSVESGQKHQ